MHSFYKLCNRPMASTPLQVCQLCHLERFQQTSGHVYYTVALRRMGVLNYVRTKNIEKIQS